MIAPASATTSPCFFSPLLPLRAPARTRAAARGASGRACARRCVLVRDGLALRCPPASCAPRDGYALHRRPRRDW